MINHPQYMRFFKSLLTSLVFVALSCQFGTSQQLRWMYKIGGLTAESGVALAQDIDDNVYDLTNFMGTVAVSNEITFTSAGSTDMLVRKSSSFGSLVWIKKLGGRGPDTGFDLKADNLGNVYITGVFQDTLRLENQVVLIGSSRPTAFVITLNSEGDFVSGFKLESSESVIIRTLTRDNTGNFTVSGEFEGTLDADPSEVDFPLTSFGGADIFYGKYNASGQFIWAYSFGTVGPEYALKHFTDNQGNTYMTGEFRNRINFFTGQNDYILNTSGQSDCFVIKLDSNGHTIWAKSVGGTGIDVGQDITIDNQGHIIVAGKFSATVDFNPGGNFGLVSSRGGYDAFVLKLTTDGDFVWVSTFGGSMSDQATSVVTNFTGVIFIGGTFRDSVNFDNRPGKSNSTMSAGGDDGFYLVLNQDGTYNDHFVIGGLANEQINDLMLRTNGDLISTGAFGAIVDFDPSPDVINIISTGGLDAFLLNFFVCVNPYLKDVRVVTPNICWGERGLVQIAEAYLNGATQWSWQRNDCNSITFASGDFLDLRLTSDVSYFIKGSGGCVTKNDCVKADIRVFVDSLNYVFAQLCEGDSISIGNDVYYNAGVYIDTLTSIAGCDSVIITEIAVNPTYSLFSEFTICHGDSLVIGEITYTNPGIYTSFLQTDYGCDSILTVQLNVIPSNITMQSITICEGDIFTVGEDVYTESGTYTYTTISDQGCEDYIITELHVTRSMTFQEISICEGDSVIIGSNIYRESGVYTDSLISENGCDSTLITTIQLFPVFSLQQEITFCDGDSLQVGDKYYFNTGMYIDTLQTINGCDSIITSNLTVLEVPAAFEVFVDLCRGDSWAVGVNVYTESGTYIDVFRAANGCDSVIISNIRVQETDFIQEITICQGDSIMVGDSIYFADGQYTNLFNGSTGCDSILTTILVTIAPVVALSEVKVCPGDSISVGNNVYILPGIYRDTFISLVTGCDSILMTNLSWHETEFYQEVNLCIGESVIIGENVYDLAGIYIDTIISQAGCESILTTKVSVLEPAATINAKICEGSEFTIGSNTYTESGTYYNTFTSESGCDSIVTLHLTIIPTINTEGYFELCRGDSITLGGIVYYNSAIHTDTLLSSLGCDSISRITLNFTDFDATLSTDGNMISVFATDGAIYRWYNCEDPEVTLSTGNAPVFIAPLTGSYAVEITFKDCIFLSECVDIEISSAWNDFLKGFTVYPNPASDFVNIETQQYTTIHILHGNGKHAGSAQLTLGVNQLDISRLTPGIYLLRIQTDRLNGVVRLIKK